MQKLSDAVAKGETLHAVTGRKSSRKHSRLPGDSKEGVSVTALDRIRMGLLQLGSDYGPLFNCRTSRYQNTSAVSRSES